MNAGESINCAGKIWRFEANINTDLILPSRCYYLPPEEQLDFIFQSNRPGWVEGFSKGEILVAEPNFGMGSSRPAARNLRLLGVACLLADTINGLFFRNCVNFGLPAMECPGVSDAFAEGQTAEVDFDAATVRNRETGQVLPARAVPPPLLRIMAAGGIYPLLEAEGKIAPLDAAAS